MAKKPKAMKSASKPKAKAGLAAGKTQGSGGIDPRAQFLAAFEREHPVTLRVLGAYPSDKLDLKPHAKCKSARDLAWEFVKEQGLAETALTRGLDWSKPFPAAPPAPASLEDILAALQRGHQKVVEVVKAMSQAELGRPVKFPVAPKTLADVPKLQLLWMLLCDQIHHRGQFSIYLRMAEGKVPSIYGPTADEPWN